MGIVLDVDNFGNFPPVLVLSVDKVINFEFLEEVVVLEVEGNFLVHSNPD